MRWLAPFLLAGVERDQLAHLVRPADHGLDRVADQPPAMPLGQLRTQPERDVPELQIVPGADGELRHVLGRDLPAQVGDPLGDVGAALVKRVLEEQAR